MSVKEALEKKIETQLEKWEDQIKEMKAKAKAQESKAEAEKADAKLQQEYYDKIEKIQNAYGQTKQKLDELRQAGDDSWESIKTEVEKLLKSN